MGWAGKWEGESRGSVPVYILVCIPVADSC